MKALVTGGAGHIGMYIPVGTAELQSRCAGGGQLQQSFTDYLLMVEQIRYDLYKSQCRMRLPCAVIHSDGSHRILWVTSIGMNILAKTKKPAKAGFFVFFNQGVCI
jgi:hypothetical protein